MIILILCKTGVVFCVLGLHQWWEITKCWLKKKIIRTTLCRHPIFSKKELSELKIMIFFIIIVELDHCTDQQCFQARIDDKSLF